MVERGPSDRAFDRNPKIGKCTFITFEEQGRGGSKSHNGKFPDNSQTHLLGLLCFRKCGHIMSNHKDTEAQRKAAHNDT